MTKEKKRMNYIEELDRIIDRTEKEAQTADDKLKGWRKMGDHPVSLKSNELANVYEHKLELYERLIGSYKHIQKLCKIIEDSIEEDEKKKQEVKNEQTQ